MLTQVKDDVTSILVLAPCLYSSGCSILAMEVAKNKKKERRRRRRRRRSTTNYYNYYKLENNSNNRTVMVITATRE